MITVSADALLSPLDLIRRLPDMFRSMRSDSLIEYTAVTRVEPIAIIDHTIADQPIMRELALSITALYAAYYLQAVAVTTNINNVEVARILEKLNPARNPVDTFGNMLALESKYQPKYDNPFAVPGFGLESVAPRVTFKPAVETLYEEHETDEQQVHTVQMHHQTNKQIADMALNLSTGLQLNVEVNIDEHTATIPVSVRLITSIANTDVVTQMVIYSAKDKSLKARYTGYKTGELSILDMMVATDLVDAHRKALIKDDSGNYAEILRRKNKNRLSGFMSANPSVATASNILIISKDTLDNIEGEIGGKINNNKLRDRIFKDTYLILLVIVDPRWERVTIWHRGIALPTEMGFRDLKSTKNASNIDVGEILKMYQMGRNPTF